MILFSSPDAREKPRLFLASFGKAAGIGMLTQTKPFAAYHFIGLKESPLL